MKRKRIIVLSLIVWLILFIQGCGSSGSSHEGIEEDYQEYEDEYEDKYEDEYGESEEPEDENYSESLENAVQNSADAKGILALTIDCTGGPTVFKVIAIDPETNNQKEIVSYSMTSSMKSDFYLSGNARYSSYRDLLSPNLDKLACTKYLVSGEEHAGWLTPDGDFYDVTENLGLHSQGDFSEKKNYTAIGFSEDNNFVFSTFNGSRDDYYYVPADNISADLLVSGNPYKNADLMSDLECPVKVYGGDYHVTEWINDTRCIVDKDGNYSELPTSLIANITDSSDKQEYIPETSSRQNWSGVLSPDGQTIAFLSHDVADRSEGSGNVSDLYIVPISGGEPTKIPTDLPFTGKYDIASSAITEITKDKVCVTLIGWK